MTTEYTEYRTSSRSKLHRPCAGFPAAVFFLVLLFAGAVLGTAEPAVFCRPQAEPGEVLLIRVREEQPLSSCSAEVFFSEGRSNVFRGFTTDEWRPFWVIPVGIPPDMRLGRLTVGILSKTAGNSGPVYEKAETVFLDIVERKFSNEDILLNTGLTRLRTDDADRKWEESRKLSEILMRWEKESLFEMGKFLEPVDSYRISSQFGDRRTYRYSDGTSAPAIHTGIDLAAPTGTPIKASGSGRVVLAADRMLTGITVVIEHLPGIYSLYYHLDSLECREGEEITRGQRIGTVGMTGLATGPHLHWEVRVSGIPVDPFFFVKEPLLDKELIKGNSGDENTKEGGD
jgi:hypothetical protein